MIRIYDPISEARISSNLTYTTNPKLYNLNDWVIIDRGFNIDDAPAINPYVIFTVYNSGLKFDDSYEIILCRTRKELNKLIDMKLANKMIYLIPDITDVQVNQVKPIIINNSFSNEQQVKTNFRNLYAKDKKVGYAVQINRLFYYDALAFFKFKQQNNVNIYISCELKCDELYTTIGINSELDIDGLDQLESNIVEFNVCDRFNRLLVMTNLVLDFDQGKLFEPINREIRLNRLKFARKSYLTIFGLKDPSDVIFNVPPGIEFDIQLATGMTSDIAVPIGVEVIFKQHVQVILRNYYHLTANFATNVKRQKVAKIIDDMTRLIIIYDPSDRGFVNCVNRENSYEIALNKRFTFEQIQDFAHSYSEYLGIQSDRIVYVIDSSVVEFEHMNDSNLYMTSGYNIKNSIVHRSVEYNFTNIAMWDIEPRIKQLMICQLEFDPETEIYSIVVPETLNSSQIFIRAKSGDRVLCEATKVNDNRVRLYSSFFKEVLNMEGNVTVNLELFGSEYVYSSNSFELVVEDDKILPNYNLPKMAVYTICEDEVATCRQLELVAERFGNCDVKYIEYNTDFEFELFIAEQYGVFNLSYDEYVLLYPLYLRDLGYSHFVFLKEGVIFEPNATMLEIGTHILDVKTIIDGEYEILCEKPINYISMSVVEYSKLLIHLAYHRVSGVELGTNTIEESFPHSPVIDFNHPVSPWDSNNLQLFDEYTAEGIYLNVELFASLEPLSSKPIYQIPISKRIMRNNQLLNIGSRQKKLSIIITTYCNEDSIYDTLTYIVNNNPLVSRDYEILIFDDCSPDNTVEVINKFFTRNPHVIKSVNVNPHNMRYPGYGANQGIRMARGKYVHVVDGDDIVINNIYAAFNNLKLEEDVISFGHYNHDVSRDEYITARYYAKNKFIDSYPYETSRKEYKMLQANVTHWNKFFRTEFLHRNNLYYLENQLVQDSAFLTDVYYCRPTVQHIPEMGYIYHIGQESVSSSRKGYKLFQDFVNANMKRTPLVDSLFPQYTYTLKRFMIYDEIKEDDLEAIVDLLCDKYAGNYRVHGLTFFNKGRMLYKMMHILLIEHNYDAIRTFLKLTDEFKITSGYLDSKYYDSFLAINRLDAVANFIVVTKIIKALFADHDEEFAEQFEMYYEVSQQRIENDIENMRVLVANDYDIYRLPFEYVRDNLEQSYIDLESVGIEVERVNIPRFDLCYEKTKRKVIVVKHSNQYIRTRLQAIDRDIIIYEVSEDEETCLVQMKEIHQYESENLGFVLVLDGRGEINYTNLYLIYHTAYSASYSLVKLGCEDDMFAVANRYLINPRCYTVKQFSHLAIFNIHHLVLDTEKIEIVPSPLPFYNPSTIARGYEKPDSHNMELLNDLFHNSEILRSVKYEERKKANMYVFDFNVEE